MKAAKLVQERMLTAFKGGNFSGRTELLRKSTGLDLGLKGDLHLPKAYIGPEVVNAISGLAPTVQEEIALHCHNAESSERSLFMGENLNISHLYNRNPFSLSGGEQVALTLASSVALEPSVLAVDSALEQLALPLRKTFINLLRTEGYPKTLLADNRLSEVRDCFDSSEIIEMPCAGETESDFRTRKIRNLPQQPLGPSWSCHVSLEGLSFSYTPERVILQDVWLHLEPGNVYHLAGANGAGKSTLAKLLVGVLQPKRGNILVNQSQANFWRAPGKIVGFSFQNPDLQLFSSTVWNEVSAGLRKHAPAWHNIATNALSTFGLDGLEEHHPLDLPFVLRKRLTLAVALGSGKPWIILDEPNLGQDDEAVSMITDVIDTYRKQGGGVLLISHSASLFDRLKPRTILLENGRIQ